MDGVGGAGSDSADYNNSVNETEEVQTEQVQTAQATDQPQEATEPKTAELAPEDKSSPEQKAYDLKTQGDERKKELQSGVIGAVVGQKAGGINDNVVAAGKEYDKAYSDGLAKMKSGAADAPKDLVELNKTANKAYTDSLAKKGLAPVDSYQNNVQKTADILTDKASRPGEPRTVSPEEVKLRIQKGTQPEFLARVLNEKYLSDPNRAKLTGSEKAWMTPVEDISGLKLNKDGIREAVGFTQQDIANANAKGDKPTLLTVKSGDMKGVTAPTWDEMTKLAKGNSDFSQFSQTDLEGARKISDFDPKTGKSEYQNHLEKAKTGGFVDDKGYIDPKKYAETLPPAEKNAFLARNQMEKTFGANPLYDGTGATRTPDGKVGVREVLAQNSKVTDLPRHAFVELNDGTQKTKTLANIFDGPGVSRSEIKGGAATGAIISGGLSAVENAGAVWRGEKTVGDAVLDTTKDTAVGAGTGVATAVAENYAGRAITNVIGAGETALGTAARRVGGSGVAGALVSGGIATIDNVAKYRNGEISGSRAIGNIAGEVAVGTSSALAGAAAGAALGSIVPGAGTVVGAAVGFAAGYLADKGLRGLGVDKAIADGVTGLAEGAKNIASNAINKLSSIFGW